MRITVFGASGGVGRLVMKQGLERGHVMRGVYRVLPVEVDEGCEVLRAEDIRERGIIEAAIAGADVVVCAVGLRRRHAANPWSRIVSPVDLTSDFARALCGVLKGAGFSGRVVAVSAAGVGEDWDRVGMVLRMLFKYSNVGVAYDDLAKMEQVFKGSGLDWVCVKPTTLNDRKVVKAARVVAHFGLTAQISRASVAAYILDMCEGAAVATRVPMISS